MSRPPPARPTPWDWARPKPSVRVRQLAASPFDGPPEGGRIFHPAGPPAPPAGSRRASRGGPAATVDGPGAAQMVRSCRSSFRLLHFFVEWTQPLTQFV